MSNLLEYLILTKRRRNDDKFCKLVPEGMKPCHPQKTTKARRDEMQIPIHKIILPRFLEISICPRRRRNDFTNLLFYNKPSFIGSKLSTWSYFLPGLRRRLLAILLLLVSWSRRWGAGKKLKIIIIIVCVSWAELKSSSRRSRDAKATYPHIFHSMLAACWMQSQEITCCLPPN